MKDCVIVDIDGTIAKVGDRLKYLQQEKKDWDSFYEHCDEDEPINDIIELVVGLHNYGYRIVFCTGRRESVREKTEKWICKHLNMSDYGLLMRKDKDFRHDSIIKPELLNEMNETPMNVLCILEDRNSMVEKWRELGYTCLQVNEGDF